LVPGSCHEDDTRLVKTHLETDASPEAIAERLIMLATDVEGVETAPKVSILHRGFGHSAEPHPNADRLKVCVVTLERKRSKSSRAPNAHAGMKGVFAPLWM